MSPMTSRWSLLRIVRRLLGAGTVVATLVVGAPSAGAQEAPPATLPPPPVTVQDVINQLLPVIRQLQPVTDQVGPLLRQIDPLLAQGGAFAEQMNTLSSQLAPFVAQVSPLVETIGAALAPVWSTVDTQVSPQLQDLLALFGPYINQVDMATAFQVIGPVAPTAVKVIPTANKFYDSLDVVAPLRDPISCPLARAAPQQKLLDIVVPFLCYNAIVQESPPGGGGGDTPSPPASSDVPTPEPLPAEDPAAPAATSPIAAEPLPGSDASGAVVGPGASSVDPASGGSLASGEVAQPALVQPVADRDRRVDELEARMRLMMVLLAGISALAWAARQRFDEDSTAGAGMFRKERSGAPPPLT